MDAFSRTVQHNRKRQREAGDSVSVGQVDGEPQKPRGLDRCGEGLLRAGHSKFVRAKNTHDRVYFRGP